MAAMSKWVVEDSRPFSNPTMATSRMRLLSVVAIDGGYFRNSGLRPGVARGLKGPFDVASPIFPALPIGSVRVIDAPIVVLVIAGR